MQLRLPQALRRFSIGLCRTTCTQVSLTSHSHSHSRSRSRSRSRSLSTAPRRNAGTTVLSRSEVAPACPRMHPSSPSAALLEPAAHHPNHCCARWNGQCSPGSRSQTAAPVQPAPWSPLQPSWRRLCNHHHAWQRATHQTPPLSHGRRTRAAQRLFSFFFLGD